MRVVACLLTEHNLWLVLLAAIVCISGSGITFGLYARARERSGLQKQGWTFLTVQQPRRGLTLARIVLKKGDHRPMQQSGEPL